MANSIQQEARAAFVEMVKEENRFTDYSKVSLRAHWGGAFSGFANDRVQSRWLDFRAGFFAARRDHAN